MRSRFPGFANVCVLAPHVLPQSQLDSDCTAAPEALIRTNRRHAARATGLPAQRTSRPVTSDSTLCASVDATSTIARDRLGGGVLSSHPVQRRNLDINGVKLKARDWRRCACAPCSRIQDPAVHCPRRPETQCQAISWRTIIVALRDTTHTSVHNAQ